ncbi:hypothetical protein FB563_3419 [Streptomyces puniciscabiei]|uniref:Uncharacterized protein n=1 Tax=Streptomyces puniciscabiei TaxID=164348 RepID=A0A542UH54_9ACTN|nr:hypothetical protein [Streptomyces puniciscabiei]TQK98396.1 hypothetical protein FB563_3419 [Streptomyces puniciscabiei]
MSGPILEEFPQASVALSNGMPTCRVEKGRLHIGVWRHGVSIHGWGTDPVLGVGPGTAMF